MPDYSDPRALLNDLLLWWGAIRDLIPPFEVRMANKEKRIRLRHAKGKMSDAELKIRLDAIKQKLAAQSGR